jgi:hypothetical protein
MAPLAGALYTLHTGESSTRLWQTVFNNTILTIDARARFKAP